MAKKTRLYWKSPEGLLKKERMRQRNTELKGTKISTPFGKFPSILSACKALNISENKLKSLID